MVSFWKIFQNTISEQFWEQGVQGVLKLKLQTFFTHFFLDFLANVSEFFKQDFLLIIWSKESIFGFEKLGEDCKSIFSKLYSPSNKPSIFRK